MGFSLVEMMACVAIIGIIAFMAIPSVTRMRLDSERNMVIARAEALNLAISSYIQMRGRTQAALEWAAAGSDQARYNLLKPYLSFPDDSLSTYLCGYGTSTVFPSSLTPPLKKAVLTNPTGGLLYY